MSETAPQGNGKKIAIAAVVLAAAVILFGAIYILFSPKPEKDSKPENNNDKTVSAEGAKELSIEVVDDQGKSKKYTVHTDAEYLREALEETEGLTVEGTEDTYGLRVEAVNGLTADFNTNGAYWAFYLNDEYCNYGVDQQPVKDGESYRIVYTTGQ